MLTCPICAGPLHVQDPERVFCDRGHEMTSDDAARRLNHRLQEALWMALNALETEAEMWRSVAELDGSDKAMIRTDEIDDQAELIRSVLRLSDSDA